MTILPRPHSLLRAALAAGPGPVLGTWVKLPAVESVELMALAGFDFVVIDLEHTAMSLETAHRLIGTALFAGVAPIVRVPGLDGGIAQRVLDAGAEGIMVPHVDTADEARAAAATVRFPPRGNRGVGATARAGAWGAIPRAEYLRFGQEEVVLITQIESAEAVRNASAIAAVDGVDALLVGMADLSTSEGITETDPAALRLAHAAIGAAHDAGLPVGTAGGATEGAVRCAADAGYDFVLLSNDASLLGAAAVAAVAAGRSVAEERIAG
jgi:2-keto-3-deoxy-L-rhamnonate aldolase RhmA